MKKRQSIMIAVAGASLFAASQVTAQDASPISASAGDLLLNFRNTANIGNNDVEVDLGNINTFLTAATAIGATFPLDSGATAANPGYAPLFSIAELTSDNGLQGAPGEANQIGFSAIAIVAANNTSYQTRIDTTPGLVPAYHPQQPNVSNGDKAATAINNIGIGASGGELGYLTPVTALGGSDPIVAVPSANVLSYQANGQTSISVQGSITFNGSQNINGNEPIEIINMGCTVYAALWEVPVSGNGSDTYEGYFTFQPSGEVDFTPANAAYVSVPPNISIARSGDNVLVTWPNTGDYVLQQNTVAATNGWASSGYAVSTTNCINSVTVTPTAGNLFFRLANH